MPPGFRGGIFFAWLLRVLAAAFRATPAQFAPPAAVSSHPAPAPRPDPYSVPIPTTLEGSTP